MRKIAAIKRLKAHASNMQSRPTHINSPKKRLWLKKKSKKKEACEHFYGLEVGLRAIYTSNLGLLYSQMLNTNDWAPVWAHPHRRPVQDLHWRICVCLLHSFLPLLATQAQLHRTVDSPWTADAILRRHILRLLNPRLIRKKWCSFFSFQAFSLGGWQGEGE